MVAEGRAAWMYAMAIYDANNPIRASFDPDVPRGRKKNIGRQKKREEIQREREENQTPAGVCLAGELSILAALAEGHFVQAHASLGRRK